MLLDITLVIFAYLIGSLSAAIIICYVMGLDDPRKNGSKNPGATNVLRLHGKTAGIIALFGDMLKGIIPVMLAGYLEAPDWVVAACGLAVFLGHLFPVFFQFRGGKGVATLLGVLLATGWMAGILFIITWLLVAGLTRYSSLAGMTAAVTSPIYTFILMESIPYTVTLFIMSALLLWRHRENIRRLLSGTESRIGNRGS